jgi:hypothetical protein
MNNKLKIFLSIALISISSFKIANAHWLDGIYTSGNLKRVHIEFDKGGSGGVISGFLYNEKDHTLTCIFPKHKFTGYKKIKGEDVEGSFGDFGGLGLEKPSDFSGGYVQEPMPNYSDPC